MKITDVEVLRMRAGTEPNNNWLFVRIHTDEGISGVGEGSLQYKDVALQAEIENFATYLRGKDPFQIEHIWTSLHRRVTWTGGAVTISAISAIDLALWDLAGRALDIPCYKMLGGYRDKVPAYASTMCGDDLENGLATPKDYANLADWAMKRGYPAYKLHTWQPPYEGAPSVKRDLEACAAVREVVGPDVPCMLDPYHYYDREAALALAKGLEELDYYWMEEPMDEHSMSSVSYTHLTLPTKREV